MLPSPPPPSVQPLFAIAKARSKIELQPHTPIALIGLPGSGKSTVTKLLARRLGWSLCDSDAVIEQRTQSSIKDFFEREGEAAFRAVESEVIAEITQQARIVLATGGGAILADANRACLHQRCQVIYLHSSPEQLYKRLRRDTQRPLLQVADPLAKLHELYAQRHPLYQQTAHHTIESGPTSVFALVEQVLAKRD